MSTVVIVGAQWGDEAKGKMADVFGQQADLVVRYSGGNNAGHTIVIGDKTFKLQLLPAGILHSRATAVLGGGMTICPKALLEEYKRTKELLPELGHFMISPAAHVVMPYHRALDVLEENARGANKIGTTSRGIGPAYTDKVQRIGIRMGEFVQPEVFKNRLSEVLEFKNRLMELLGGVSMEWNDIISEFSEYAEQLAPYVGDTEKLVQDAQRSGKKILFEGAQGAFLDLDHGTYPYVTSSHPTAGGACLGSGLGPRDIDSILGVCKAYTTRVGEGPFPTELNDATGEQIRKQGNEFGTVTGRPRRCGWMDLVALRHSARINSLSGLIITRLDTLQGIGDLNVGVGYQKDGKLLDGMPYNLHDWEGIVPQYKTLAGWDEDISGARSWEDLPAHVQEYVTFIESFVDVPAAVLSVGPERSQTIVRKPELIWG